MPPMPAPVLAPFEQVPVAEEEKEVPMAQEEKEEGDGDGDGDGEEKKEKTGEDDEMEDGEEKEKKEEDAEAEDKPEPVPEPEPEPIAAPPAPAAAAAAYAEPEMPKAELVPMTPYLSELAELITENLSPFCVSLHLEVRERSCQLHTILDIMSAAEEETPGEGVAIMEQFAVVLSEEVQPVSIKAQRKVEPPASLLLTAPLAKEWDSLLVSSGDEESDDEDVGSKGKKKKGGKKGGKKDKNKDVTDLFTVKKSKEQIAKEEAEAREMLAKHREKMGNYYLGSEVPASAAEETGGKKKKKGKKGKEMEAIAPAPGPSEPVMTEYMKQSMAGGKMARPTIKGESDSSEDEDDEAVGGVRAKLGVGGNKYAPKNAAASLHAGLGNYDPLKPLGRGEEMPAVEAYPAFDPYANEGGEAGNAFSVSQGGKEKRRKSGKEDKAVREEKKRAHEAKKAAQKAAKAAQKEGGGGSSERVKKEKKEKKEPKAEKKASKGDKGDKKKAKKVSSKMAEVHIGEA